MGRLLTLAEVATRTGTTVRFWRGVVFNRKIPIVKLGRLVRIDEQDLEAFVDANRQAGQP
jgi:excisionase family DNA binding protein